MAHLWFAGVPSGTGKPEESTGRTGFAGWLSGAETAKNSLPGLADRPVMEQAGNGLAKRTESVCGPAGFYCHVSGYENITGRLACCQASSLHFPITTPQMVAFAVTCMIRFGHEGFKAISILSPFGSTTSCLKVAV